MQSFYTRKEKYADDDTFSARIVHVSVGDLVMKTKTNVKAGGIQHNEVQVTGLRVKTRVKAGLYTMNHNEALVSARTR